MDAARIDEIELFLRAFNGPADEQSERLRRECLTAAKGIISYSDRIRYYWGRPEALRAIDDLQQTLRGRPMNCAHFK